MKQLKPRTMAITLSIILQTLSANDKPRARDLGISFDGIPGKMNAITDVEGVKVGHSTIIKGKGRLKVGKGPVRTGVTAVLPRGDNSYLDPVFAGWYSLNGNGEMTGTTWVEESGFLEGPVMITNTHSVGIVRDAVISWRVSPRISFSRSMLNVAPRSSCMSASGTTPSAVQASLAANSIWSHFSYLFSSDQTCFISYLAYLSINLEASSQFIHHQDYTTTPRTTTDKQICHSHPAPSASMAMSSGT